MIQAYLENKNEGRNIGLLVTALMFGFTIIGALVAYGVAFWWLPLGEYENILLSDLNTYEVIVIIASLIYALCCARTAYGLVKREASSLRWSQWMFFISIMIGGAILLSVIIPVGLKFSLLLGQNIDLRAQINDEIGGLVPTILSIGEASSASACSSSS